jgi:hypothetical protein
MWAAAGKAIRDVTLIGLIRLFQNRIRRQPPLAYQKIRGASRHADLAEWGAAPAD